MDKKQVVGVLEEISVLLDLSGENPFKSRSYVNVARALEQHEADIETLVREKRLREVKGVGDAIEEKITELVTTGKLGYHEDLRAQFPDTIFELFDIQGLGAKRIKVLYDELGITSIADLEKACKEDRVKVLKGFSDKMQEKIVEGIEFAKKHQGQHLLNAAWREADRLLGLLKQDKTVKQIEVAGSLRRRKEVIKDIDILATCEKPDVLMKRFVEADGVARVLGHGETKSSVLLDSGIQADLRVVTGEQFPYALAYFTGSKEHNVVMRQRAKDRGLKLNEYGLYRGETNTPCADEAAIFKALDLPYIPPELREDMGEFEAKSIPKLVEQSDLKGLIHCHSTYSDGRSTLRQMVEGAKSRGYKYILISDHSQTASYAGGLHPEVVVEQHKEIDVLNREIGGIRILKGIESDIRADGSLDYEEDVLRTFDCIVISVHSKLDMTEAEATKRVVKAIESPYATVLGHCTGRLLLQRDGFPLNYEKVFDACVANDVAVEINANPHRLDIDWRYIRKGKDKGVKFSIGPDAHAVEGMDDVRYGVGIARKGWLEKGDILNCMTLEEFLAW
jgi:DNA polymerase (family 10)